ncbi:alpha/beta hydrolase family protein [Planococcus sp. 1R117A]|uniref:alpha/beta hydrolase family protein n=1 Tax=Planococcus sp. 1R117A TaxID=3447020 RepID=UPI003EDCA416
MWYFWPENYMWSYQVSRILGHTSVYGGSQFSECLEAAQRIKLGDYNSWFKEWNRLGDRVLAQANEAKEDGNLETARVHHLRAADYIRLGEFFLQPEDSRKMETYLKGIDSFKKGAELLPNPPEAIKVPYEDSYLPGYFYQSPNGDNGPVVVMFGGLDSTAEEMYYALAPYLLERGIGLIAMDGPGQGGALRINNIASRYDYEKAGTAVLEWAIQQPTVNPERIGIMAWSMGGYMAARIAAFEPRYKICGIFSGVYDYSEMWENRPDDHPLANILKHVMGVNDMKEARAKLQKYNLRNGIAEQIQCPTFILHGEDDRQGNVDHAYRVYNALTCPKSLHIVPTGQTGDVHCQADNHAQAFPLFDWLKNNL